METVEKDYPLGMQDFAQIVQGNYVYVDKTEFVYQLTHSKKYYFLSRPRRFGKTLLLSTLEYFFLGRRDLFKGLKIDSLEKDWIDYPVLHFDLSTVEGDSSNLLKSDLEEMLSEYEEKYGISTAVEGKRASIGQRFSKLIKNVNAITGKEVVILIDEYDKDILDVLRDDKKLEKNRKVLRNFFTALKANDKYIRFAMLTGVTRFRHLTIFSGLNNLVDISMDRAFATVCGITLGELDEYFQEGLKCLEENLNLNRTSLLDALKQKYDGYRFTSSLEHVFNPHSLLSAFVRKELRDYWVMSGTSKVFVEYLSEANFKIESLLEDWYDENTLGSTFDSKQPVPLLYQTGYLTLQEERNGLYRLTVPNGEVRQSLIEQLMPLYMGISKSIPVCLLRIKEKVLSGDIDGWLTELQAMIASAPYHLLTKDEENPVERFYHLMIYQVFILLGINTRSEINIAGGLIDMVSETRDLLYVMEFKLNGTPTQALKQIDKKGYALPYSADGRRLYKIGVSFSSDTHTISKWKFKES
ncbi:MAG: ATP-binding protein [Bacteroidales bacterium]|nr:ATP-binding protein [Bacteroidales bacterium]